MTPIAIFDLDGTLANVAHRLHLLDGTFVGFHRFHAACIDDTLNSKVAEVAKALNQAGNAFWVATGRPIEMEAITRYWFHAYCVVPDRILMRPVGDTRTSAEVKRAWLRDGTIPRERVLCAFDDRDVAMWRSEGLTCFEVACA
jgi:hypothetical protein